MSDEIPWYAPGHGATQLPPKGQPCELLFEFHVERTHRFYRCELRDHGSYGIEAQFLDPVDLVISHRVPTRELAVLWAEQERKALEEQVI